MVAASMPLDLCLRRGPASMSSYASRFTGSPSVSYADLIRDSRARFGAALGASASARYLRQARSISAGVAPGFTPSSS
jgi:hypothetical protein